jgi:hypothetical protein
VQQRQVDPNTARVFAFAAVRGGGGEALAHKDGSLEAGLDRLEAFCKDARHLIAHNILRHDLPHLVANRARLADLGAAAIDTLWLADGLCAVVDLGCELRLGHTTLGADAVPRCRADRAPSG